MTSLAQPPRLPKKVKHIINSTMLCCGRKKESREAVESQAFAEGSARRAGPSRSRIAHGHMPEMVIQSDFRKVSGISNEIFRQIEAVENDFDATTAAHLEAVEKRGEMIIRLLDPCTLGRAGAEACKKYLCAADSTHIVQFVEIIKRPGQTLGLYIREGDGIRCNEGVFISRIALESAVYNSGLLKVGDEILAVNLVDVRRMSLDDVVIIMSIPRRLVLTIRSRICGKASAAAAARKSAMEVRPPVVVMKKEVQEDIMDDMNSNSENGVLIRARTKGLPADIPAVAVSLVGTEPHPVCHEDLYYNSQPRGHRVAKLPETRLDEQMWTRRMGKIHPPPSVVTAQPKTHPRYPKTLESLAEQVHTFYGPPTRHPSTEVRRTRYPSHSLIYQRPERSTTARHRYWDEYSSSLRRSRLLRTESEQRIPSLGDETYERYTSRTLRPTFRGPLSMQHRGRVRRYEDVPQHVGILRRRSVIESASDTEVQSGGAKDYFLTRQRSLGRAAPPRRYSHGRSNSLPRASVQDRRHRQSVRFEKTTLPYDSQEDSDGAVSAPELPLSKSVRRGGGLHGTSPNVFTSMEYRSWLSRTPSTSAIYDRVRRGKGIRHLPRIAHSAESLLDTLRKEEQRSAYTTDFLPRRSLLRIPTDPLSHPYPLEFWRQVPHPTPLAPEDRLHLLTLNPREFFKYKPEKDSESVLRTDGFSGLLWVHLLGGRGLRPTSHSDHFRDLYCVIECDRVHKARTGVRPGEHSFDWDEMFELDLVDNSEIAFLLYSWDPQYRHKLCYKGTIHLLTLLRESPVHSLALRLEPRGTLYLKLRYRDPRQTFQRIPPLTDTGVFGIDLETIILRENSGFGVPLIIKRCVEEVEKRGLDIVGIYRLCGSAVRKKILRDGFERNAVLVDLSAEHVPDINVVTSLLKDYLRELPEPLFTKGLFDMLVDGLSVCLPDDPEGNAKLMFSILDCLPKVNRCTVLFLMDHLKLVTTHSDRNKMNPQNLSQCFGPVVMCHTETGAPVINLRKTIEVFAFLLEIWPAKRVALGSGSSESSGNEPPDQSMGQETLKKSVTWVGQRILPESSC